MHPSIGWVTAYTQEMKSSTPTLLFAADDDGLGVFNDEWMLLMTNLWNSESSLITSFKYPDKDNHSHNTQPQHLKKWINKSFFLCHLLSCRITIYFFLSNITFTNIQKHTKILYHTNFYVYFNISIFLQLFDIVHWEKHLN